MTLKQTLKHTAVSAMCQGHLLAHYCRFVHNAVLHKRKWVRCGSMLVTNMVYIDVEEGQLSGALSSPGACF